MNNKGQKVVVLGVSSSIAAYKAANLASMLRKRGYDVHVIMTKNLSRRLYSKRLQIMSA